MSNPPNHRREPRNFEARFKWLREVFTGSDHGKSLPDSAQISSLANIFGEDNSFNPQPPRHSSDQLANLQSSMLDAWDEYTNSQKISTIVPPVIASSWKRCWALINPHQDILPVRLNEAHLLTTQVTNFNLISIARPIIEDMHQNINQSRFAILLTNGAGCVLDMISDPGMQVPLNRWGIFPGAFLSEDHVGTNAIGLTLTERMPIQVCGAEHYLRQFHSMIAAAAPIFDPTGSLLGTLAVFMPIENNPPYLLSLVIVGSRAIESQYQADRLLIEQNMQLAQLSTILSAISDGILVWNKDKILIHINQAACQMIGLPKETLVGKEISSLVTIPPPISEAIANNQVLSNVEASIKIGESTHNYLITTNYVQMQNQKGAAWTIMTLRPEKVIRNLVQQQIGARAELTLDDIPGESPQIRRIRSMVLSFANAQASILIRGETGTGKNALANAVHNASTRKDGPFIIFSASSIPNELVISELLGIEDDSNSRARGSRPSKFELAQGGTLFFQDIDFLPLEAQGVLLNVLEIGIVQRIRGQRAIPVDVRIIASSTADLDALIAQGSFRPDLYYRLSSLLIDIPPLRERPNDIPHIVNRILARLSVQMEKPLSLANGLMDILKRAEWPGNVREIESVITRAATQVGPTGEIDLKSLPISLSQKHRGVRQYETETRFLSVHELERSAILRAAKLCQGNMTLMAKSLGFSRTTLWRRLKTLRIDEEQIQAYRKKQPY